MSNYKYCESLIKYERFKSKVVDIGNISMGGNNPIRIQSMTTTNTLDIRATIDQTIRIFDKGSDYVRITAPSIKEAEILKNIKKGLINKGYTKPLIADIHFTPNAAEIAARLVEKVRINPGNYADRKKFKKFEYTDEEYNNEIQRIYKRFAPLVKICKEYGTAMRIGTNHGSLSDRIMNRYGDTPNGMVESALEFIRICEDLNFYNIVISMKSSNPIVMVQAYRLLVHKMLKEKMNYPLHLGVTEAGEGMDGRIKSSIGIGTLLEDGLGDTIRVSLTEEPEFEVPIAKRLVNRYSNRKEHDKIDEININPINPFEYTLRETREILNIGGENVPRVINNLNFLETITPHSFQKTGYTYFEKDDKWGISDIACDYINIGKKVLDFEIPGTLGIIQEFSVWKNSKKKQHYPLLNLEQYLNRNNLHPKLNFLYITITELTDTIIDKTKNDQTIVLFLDTLNEHGLAENRSIFIKLINAQSKIPVIIYRAYSDLDTADLQLYSSTDIGGLLIDGLGNGLYLKVENYDLLNNVNKTSFGILQATRTRITKTEFISCPSCGRTQFDLQKITELVREKTEHLKGLKIAVMGCIVNGPGEMADANYGYVGTGYEKVSLYKEHEIVKQNIPAKNAVDELIQLIKNNNDWTEPN